MVTSLRDELRIYPVQPDRQYGIDIAGYVQNRPSVFRVSNLSENGAVNSIRLAKEPGEPTVDFAGHQDATDYANQLWSIFTTLAAYTEFGVEDEVLKLRRQRIAAFTRFIGTMVVTPGNRRVVSGPIQTLSISAHHHRILQEPANIREHMEALLV